MKYRYLFLLIALFSTVPALAQDAGVTDTFVMELTAPTASGADYKLEARLYMWSDADTVASASAGWDWIPSGLRLDSAKATAVAIDAFNGGQFLLYQNSLTSSNNNDRFQSGLFRFSGDKGLKPTIPPSRQLIATWYFTLPAGTTAPDSIVIDTAHYSSGTVYKWVDASNATYFPHYTGPAKRANPLPVDEGDKDLPVSYELHQNYPNPFNPTTTITFALPERTRVNLSIYNVLGQEIARLENGSRDFGPGQHSVTWNGLSDNGLPVASGIYFYKLQTEKFVQTKKMMFLK